MVSVAVGMKEAKMSGTRVLHRMEEGFLSVYDWLSGPPMSEQERLHHAIAGTDSIRRFPSGGL